MLNGIKSDPFIRYRCAQIRGLRVRAVYTVIGDTVIAACRASYLYPRVYIVDLAS